MAKIDEIIKQNQDLLETVEDLKRDVSVLEDRIQDMEDEMEELNNTEPEAIFPLVTLVDQMKADLLRDNWSKITLEKLELLID